MKQLTAQKLKHLKDAGADLALIDVREEWERQLYNIGGVHIPMGELISRMDEIPKDRDVVLYCEKGIRSVIAIQRLENYGFHNLFNLSGGMKAWKEGT
jgi:rhodanese-related sulfurtransferase